MVDFTGLYVMIGVGFLLAGVVALLKVGLWFWIMTQFFGHPPARSRRPPPESPAKSIKTWLGIVSAVLGIATTTVGLVKECSPEKPSQSQQQYDDYDDYQPYRRAGTICCSGMGECPIVLGGGEIGTFCTCSNILGEVAGGTICR